MIHYMTIICWIFVGILQALGGNFDVMDSLSILMIITLSIQLILTEKEKKK